MSGPRLSTPSVDDTQGSPQRFPAGNPQAARRKVTRMGFAPIEAAAKAENTAELAQLLGVHRTAIYRFRARGITVDQADAFAVTVGYHFAELWPDIHAHHEVPCESDTCDRTFTPVDDDGRLLPFWRYCSATCRNREKKRRYRATERGAENNRQVRRRYYAENRDYERRRDSRAARRARKAVVS